MFLYKQDCHKIKNFSKNLVILDCKYINGVSVGLEHQIVMLFISHQQKEKIRE